MLAVAWINAGAYDKAVDLLRDDPGRLTDPSLQYTYGLALVRSDHAAEAEEVSSVGCCASMVIRPSVLVVLGEAYAQEGNYDAAISSLAGSPSPEARRAGGRRHPRRDLLEAGTPGGGGGGPPRRALGTARAT